MLLENIVVLTTLTRMLSDGETLIFEGSPAVLGTLDRLCLTIITLGLAWLVYYIQAKSTRYKITTQRLVVEQGLFSRHFETVELFRIEDYSASIPFGQRLLGTGNLTLFTNDTTLPIVTLQRLPLDVRQLYEHLRIAAEAEQKRRGIRRVELD